MKKYLINYKLTVLQINHNYKKEFDKDFIYTEKEIYSLELIKKAINREFEYEANKENGYFLNNYDGNYLNCFKFNECKTEILITKIELIN